MVFQPPAGLPSISVRGEPYYSLTELAKRKGLNVTQHPRGLLYIGDKDIVFGTGESLLLDSVITLFDTPDKFADPDVAARSIPVLARQGKWTDHVKATPEQLASLNGPETEWLPALVARVKSTKVGQMSLIEMKYHLNKTLWNPKSNNGQVFEKLATGALEGLEWDVPSNKPSFMAGADFKGFKMEVFGSSTPYCLTAVAFIVC